MASLACSVSPCNATEWVSTNGLAVRITTDQSILHPGDTLYVNVEIQNTATNPTAIHRIPNLTEWLIVKDHAGKEFPSYPNIIAGSWLPSPAQFVVLAPGEIHSGTLSATLFDTHSYSNAHWNPQFMKLVAGLRDYDLPSGPITLHSLKREFEEEQLKASGEWHPFQDIIPAKQWIGEIRSLDLKFEVTKDSQQSGPAYPPQGVGSADP